MTARKSWRKKRKYTNSLTAQQESDAQLIAHHVKRGMNAFIVAGATVLREQYGWDEEQTRAWAEATMVQGFKYLKVTDEKTPTPN